MMQRVVLARRPEAHPVPEDFMLEEADLPQPGVGEMRLRTLHLSLDPYVGSALKGRHMSGAVPLGGVVPGEALSRVEASDDPDYPVGTLVLSRPGWQSHSIARRPEPGLAGMAAALSPAAWPVVVPDGLPLPALLGVLGMPGLTAYAGMTSLRPLPGETVVVSSASGAVGGTAGQIARQMGARVIGIAGGAQKCAVVAECFGFDACIDRHDPDWKAALAAACPAGVDAYFDSAGGSVLDGVLQTLAMRARVLLVGMMEQYNSPTMLPGHHLGPVIGRRATVTGFVVFDHWEAMPRWRALGAAWIAADRLRYVEARSAGLASAPAAFARLMRGGNVGKTIVDL